MKLTIDPEFQSIIPPLSSEELSQLEANLLADGCCDPLKTWKGILIDGHNRYRLCEQHKIKFETYEIELADRDAAKTWIIKNQFGRRNLTAYQRAELALRLEPLIAAKAKERQREHGGTAPGMPRNTSFNVERSDSLNTNEVVSKASGVSVGTLHKAKVISREAPDPVKQQLREGKTTINKEYKAVKESRVRSMPCDRE